MSFFPDATNPSEMCGCYPPELCEVPGKNITGTIHFCRSCKVTKLSDICIGEILMRAEKAGNEKLLGISSTDFENKFVTLFCNAAFFSGGDIVPKLYGVYAGKNEACE